MRPIPSQLREELSRDPYYKRCARKNRHCEGRITWEHAIIYAGRQVNEKFAIIPLCVYHHLGEGLDKALNQLIALERATEEEMKSISKVVNWTRQRDFLRSQYKRSGKETV